MLRRLTEVDRDLLTGDVAAVAQWLLGCHLYRSPDGRQRPDAGGIIVETEAYRGKGDSAAHSARGKTRSNASMFGVAGTWYVYPIHSRYCVNLVTGEPNVGEAVLIRAIEPTLGIDAMARRRQTDHPRRLTSGPGMVCEALAIDRAFDGIDALSAEASLWIETDETPRSFDVVSSPRIGVTSAKALRLRYFVDGNRYVSGRALDHNLPRRGQLSNCVAKWQLGLSRNRKFTS